jgi:hypothetical protein
MKAIPGRPTAKKVMRVATVFTGVAALATVFGPTEAAEANVPAPQPGRIWVYTSILAAHIQVCGYRDQAGSPWRCTSIQRASFIQSFGGGWRRGKVNVWLWNSAGKEYGHTCNTNRSWNGYVYGSDIYLQGPNSTPLAARNTNAC